jgi:hypothetical protein
MVDAGTNVFVFGGGEGSSMIAAEANDPNLFVQGWPRWDVDITRKDVSSLTDVTDLAIQLLATRKPPMNIIKVTLKANLEPVFGSYNIGDFCKVVIKDPRNPTTFSEYKRLLKWQLHPSSSDSVEEADLTFEGDTDV